jgi:hypothetical protein
MQMDEGSDRIKKIKWTSDIWPSRGIPNNSVPQSMANGSVQHLANNVEDVVHMVRVNIVDEEEQDEEEYLLHCFEFADDEDD